MQKKKPLDAGRFVALSPEGKPHSGLAAALSAVGIISAMVFIYWLISSPPSSAASGSASGKSIELYLSPSGAIAAGSLLSARAFSSCGNFSLLLDGLKISEGENRAEASFTATPGEHRLVAKNSECSRELSFTVVPRECNEGENRSCLVAGCPGYQICEAGRLSGCTLPKKVCVPGEVRGCSMNACQFGYAACNPCGTGFGPCKPEKESAVQGSMACPGLG